MQKLLGCDNGFFYCSSSDADAAYQIIIIHHFIIVQSITVSSITIKSNVWDDYQLPRNTVLEFIKHPSTITINYHHYHYYPGLPPPMAKSLLPDHNTTVYGSRPSHSSDQQAR